MNYIDSHLHLDCLTYDNLKMMALTGIKKIVAPIHLATVKPVNPVTIKEMWDFQLGKQLPRTEEHLIESYAMVGISMVSTPTEGLDKILEWLPEYLEKDKIVAIGEIGFEPGSKTCSDLEEQEEIIRGQLEVAKETGTIVDFHTPNPPDQKEKFTKELLGICREHNLPMSQVIIDHASEANIELALEAGATVAITVQPWREMTPGKAAKLIKEYGTDNIILDSDTADNPSDPLSVPKTAQAMRKIDMSEEEIEKVCWTNCNEVYGI